MRAIHRFQIIFLPFKLHGRVHAISVIGQMSAREVHTFLRQMRSTNAFVSRYGLGLFRQSLQFFNQHTAIGQPQRQARTHIIIESENFHFLSNFAVITLFRFFHHGEVSLQLRFFREGNSVNSGEHGIVRIVFPISSGNIGQLNGLDVTGIGNMGSST